MGLTNKQRAFCLSHALGQFLSDWEGSPEEAWQRLQNASAENPDNDDFEEAAGVVGCEIPLQIFKSVNQFLPMYCVTLQNTV